MMRTTYSNPYLAQYNNPYKNAYNQPPQNVDDEEIIIQETPQQDYARSQNSQQFRAYSEHQQASENNVVIFDDAEDMKASQQSNIYIQNAQQVSDRFNQNEDPEDQKIEAQEEQPDNNDQNNEIENGIESPKNDIMNNQHQRYGSKFFKNSQKFRQGVPTLTNKTRTVVLNEIVQNNVVENDTENQEEEQQENILDNGRLSNDRVYRKVKMNASLINELHNIEEHQRYKFQTEKFIIMFSNNPKEAIQYLVESKIVPDDNAKIAHILLTTEGISKDALNKYFGIPKEKNQQIFKAYCALLDFRGLPFVKALRLLLSRFRMAGEAQQVDRMVQSFAEVFHADNPEVFTSSDVPYVMAYSLIMLSTDAISTKIPQKNKMTKQQFVKNNLPVFPQFSASFFEDIYDDIVQEPFQTTIDYMEQIYNRMSMCHEKLHGDTMKKALNLAFDLMKGSNLIKYGRRGEPKPRKMFLSEDERRVCWRAIDREEPARYINISDVQDLALGCIGTTDIMKQHNIPGDFDAFCFSIITSYRTVDLKMNDIEIKSKWVNYLRAIILQRREQECRRAQHNLKRVENQMKRDEIWRVDIFPRWEFHWDYKKNRPLNFHQYHSVRKEETIQKQQTKANQGPSILESFCSCLKNTIPIGRNQAQQQPISQPDSNIQQYQQQQELPFQGKNQSLLLMILWKLGIPDWARKTLWPISIGNRLEFTESLYNIHLNQVNMAKRNLQHVDKWIRQAFNKINEDLSLLTRTHSIGSKIDEGKLQSLSNILHAFVFYRPDFGYIQGMCNLAGVLILYMGEYEAMQSFINLIHSYHFLPLFKGDMREIEWRVKFFDEQLARILPLVYNHFKALDLSSEIFLIKWFMTLFSNNIEIGMLSRLWDNFLLEGEIYMFKCAIAYIKYFQLELKMSPFDDVVHILKTDPPEINEDYFFITTDEVPIKEEEYKKFIAQQQMALLNTQIHVAMLDQ